MVESSSPSVFPEASSPGPVRPLSRKVAMIWAQDRNGVIGSGHDMLWHVPADFKHFKESTLGHPVIMGRASWEALGCQPLPGRRNIVITRQNDYSAPGAELASSLADALAQAGDVELIWIAGGGQIYRQAMEQDLADELVVTDLDLTVNTSGPIVSAPPIDPTLWTVDETRSDSQWRPQSGDARWRVTTYIKR